MTTKLVHVSREEVACLIIEGWNGVSRPHGYTPQQAMAHLTEEERQRWVAIADSVVGYVARCMDDSIEIPKRLN